MTPEYFALNKNTFFKFGRQRRGTRCRRTLFPTISSKEHYSIGSEWSGFSIEQRGICKAKQKILQCILGCKKGIRGGESEVWPSSM